MEKGDFCWRLTQLRLNKGVSARDMSLSIGQSPNYINGIESGQSYPSMQNFFYQPHQGQRTAAHCQNIAQRPAGPPHRHCQSHEALAAGGVPAQAFCPAPGALPPAPDPSGKICPPVGKICPPGLILGRIRGRIIRYQPVCWNWQTRRTQNPLVATPCGFDPHHRHHRSRMRKHSGLFICHPFSRPAGRFENANRRS